MTIHIIGAGMAGLLAARMLAHRKPEVWEAQASLPNNHSAVLRFRSPLVGDVLGIPFKRVTMIKGVIPWRNEVADALAYSLKSTGLARSDRSISYGPVTDDRWIAPPDLISRMAEGVSINYGKTIDFSSTTDWPVISTIPMPSLMKLLSYPNPPEFKYRHGTNIIARLPDVDAYVTLMFPDPHEVYSRISITGDKLIIECPGASSYNSDPDTIFSEDERGHSVQLTVLGAAQHLGVGGEIEDVKVVPQLYAKILPIDEDIRKAFMFWSTIEKGVYKLGRYGTWRPKLLADDLVQDVRRIDQWINSPDPYQLSLRR